MCTAVVLGRERERESLGGGEEREKEALGKVVVHVVVLLAWWWSCLLFCLWVAATCRYDNYYHSDTCTRISFYLFPYPPTHLQGISNQTFWAGRWTGSAHRHQWGGDAAETGPPALQAASRWGREAKVSKFSRAVFCSFSCFSSKTDSLDRTS